MLTRDRKEANARWRAATATVAFAAFALISVALYAWAAAHGHVSPIVFEHTAPLRTLPLP